MKCHCHSEGLSQGGREGEGGRGGRELASYPLRASSFELPVTFSSISAALLSASSPRTCQVYTGELICKEPRVSVRTTGDLETAAGVKCSLHSFFEVRKCSTSSSAPLFHVKQDASQLVTTEPRNPG